MQVCENKITNINSENKITNINRKRVFLFFAKDIQFGSRTTICEMRECFLGTYYKLEFGIGGKCRNISYPLSSYAVEPVHGDYRKKTKQKG